MNGYGVLLAGVVCVIGLLPLGFVLWAVCAVGGNYDERVEMRRWKTSRK